MFYCMFYFTCDRSLNGEQMCGEQSVGMSSSQSWNDRTCDDRVDRWSASGRPRGRGSWASIIDEKRYSDVIHSRDGPYAWFTTPCVAFHYKLTFNWPAIKPTHYSSI